MKKLDAVTVKATFELTSSIVNRESAIEGIAKTIEKAWEDNYKDIGKIRLINIETNSIDGFYK